MTEVLGSDGVTLDDRSEQAKRAVRAFRQLQPILSSYARILSGKKNARVEMAARDNGSTDGTRIFYRPPLALGDATPHNRALCDKRDALGIMRCPACAIRERVLVTIYHEINHIAFDSFMQITDYDKRQTIEFATKEVSGRYGETLAKRISESAKIQGYMNLARYLNEYLPFIVNCLEDARVNEQGFQAREGTRKMFQANTARVFREGVEGVDKDGKTVVKSWRDAPINNQIIVGTLCKASGYDYNDWFDPEVVRVLDDPELTSIVGGIKTVRSASGVYNLSLKVLARLRTLGYLATESDPDPEPEPEPEPDPEPEEAEDGQDPDSPDSEEGSPDSDSLPEESGPSKDQDAPEPEPTGHEEEAHDQPSEGDESSESDSDGEPEAGTGPSEEDEVDDDSVREQSGGESDDIPGDESSGDSEGDSHEPDSEGDGDEDESRDASEQKDGDGDPDEAGKDSSSHSDSDQDELDSGGELSSEVSSDDSDDAESSDDSDPDESEAGSDSSEPGEPGNQDHGSGQGPDDSDPDGDPWDESSSDGDPSDGESLDGSGDDSVSEPRPDDGAPSGRGDESSHESSDDTGDSGTPGGIRGSGDIEGGGETDAGSPLETDAHDVSGDSTEAEAGEPDGTQDDDSSDVEAIDTGADDGYGGTEIVDSEDGAGTDREDEPERGTPEEIEPILIEWMGHDKPHTAETVEDDKAVDQAIVQGIYFTTPSKNIVGVSEYFIGDEPDDNRHYAWSELKMRRARRIGKDADIEVPEQILQPALLRSRRTFADNSRGAVDRGKRSGKVNAKALGKRAPVGDDRLFLKRSLPGRKDYFVVLGVDVSGSTAGVNLALEKRAVMAQAELLDRVGVEFAIYAHTGSPISDRGYQGQRDMRLDIYHIKDRHEKWNSETKARLASIGPSAFNLDGHAMEFLRKRLDESDATDKVLLYYSDGKMPAENHDEELSILQREIRICRQKDYTLLGVGIRTDSPARHGLETAEVHEDKDLIKVIELLGRRLERR